MNKKPGVSPEEMVKVVDDFIDQVLDSMNTDEDRYVLLTTEDITIDFMGCQVYIPINADTIDALSMFMKRIVEDKNYEGGFGYED